MNEEKKYVIAYCDKSTERWSHLPFLTFSSFKDAKEHCTNLDDKHPNLTHQVIHKEFICCLEEF